MWNSTTDGINLSTIQRYLYLPLYLYFSTSILCYFAPFMWEILYFLLHSSYGN